MYASGTHRVQLWLLLSGLRLVVESALATYLTWDADQERVKLARGSDTWEMIYDPTASVPAVLLAKNYVSSTTTYMYNVREPGGELLASFDAAGTPNKYYYHFDNLGSAVLVTDGSGTKVSSYTYGAWGNIPASSGTDLTMLRERRFPQSDQIIAFVSSRSTHQHKAVQAAGTLERG